jgi:hypothetical protein
MAPGYQGKTVEMTVLTVAGWRRSTACHLPAAPWRLVCRLCSFDPFRVEKSRGLSGDVQQASPKLEPAGLVIG